MSLISALGTNQRITSEKQLRESAVLRMENVDLGNGEKINLLEGIKDKFQKQNMAILYENQINALLEETSSQSSGSFETVAFAMVRRVFSKLLANEIVSVQAMSHPTSSVFFFYPEISDRVIGVDGEGRETQSHSSNVNKSLPACVGANCPDVTFSGCYSLYDAYYNEELYDHSKGKFTIITASGATYALQNRCFVPTTTIPTATDGSIRQVYMGISGFDGNNPGTSVGHTARLGGVGGKGLEIDTHEFLASLVAINAGAPLLAPDGTVLFDTGDQIPLHVASQRYAKSAVDYSDLCSADGILYVELDFRVPFDNCETCPTFDGYTGLASGTTIAPTDIAFAWRRYDDLEFSSEMGEVSFTIKKITLAAQPRKLRASWSPELVTDINAYHSLDAEAELTAIMSEHVAMEIDREILLMLKKGAAWRRHWNYLGWKNQGSQKYTQKEWNQTLITEINRLSAQIHKATLRGGANFIVVSPEVSAIFDDLDYFMVSDAEAGQNEYNMGMRRSGTLSGRYTVYVDPYSRAGSIIVGHKGTSILDAGFIYAPYVPVQLTNIVVDPNNFTNRRALMTRYATAMINNKYYAHLIVDNIVTFDVGLLH